MESLRLKQNDIYKIEVNDNGECIEFDLADIELTFKCVKALDEIDKIKQSIKMKDIAISNKQDTPGKYMSKNEEERLTMLRYAFKDMRRAMDMFLGQGACQKIFGDRNYLEMFDDLIVELAPHLEKMQINADGMKKRITEKYSNKKSNVIE